MAAARASIRSSKAATRCSVPAGADQHALAIVQDFAVEPEIARDAPHGRAKPDALHAAAHADLDRDRRPGNGIEERKSSPMPEPFPARLTCC